MSQDTDIDFGDFIGTDAAEPVERETRIAGACTYVGDRWTVPARDLQAITYSRSQGLEARALTLGEVDHAEYPDSHIVTVGELVNGDEIIIPGVEYTPDLEVGQHRPEKDLRFVYQHTSTSRALHAYPGDISIVLLDPRDGEEVWSIGTLRREHLVRVAGAAAPQAESGADAGE